MIDLAVLGLLKGNELHGYELRKRLMELPGARAGAVSFGSLYPALNRLERAGLVKAVEAGVEAPRRAPSSGSLAGELAAFRARHNLSAPGGRSRKVYGITEPGSQQLLELLTEPQPDDDRTFALKVAFCRHLGPAERVALFERRRADVTARLTERRRHQGRDRLLDRYLRSLTERDNLALTHDLTWLDGLIAAERSAPSQETAS